MSHPTKGKWCIGVRWHLRESVDYDAVTCFAKPVDWADHDDPSHVIIVADQPTGPELQTCMKVQILSSLDATLRAYSLKIVEKPDGVVPDVVSEEPTEEPTEPAEPAVEETEPEPVAEPEQPEVQTARDITEYADLIGDELVGLLIDAGITTDTAASEHPDLAEIKGIGAKSKAKILAAINQ